MKNMGNEEFNHEKIPNGTEGEEIKLAKVAERKEEMMRRQLESIKRGKEKDIWRRFLIERSEAEQEQTIVRAEEFRGLKCLQAQQTQKLGEELLRRINNEMREQKLRQLLRNDSIKLRQLEDDIRVAYAAKAAKVQLSEQKTNRENSRNLGIMGDRMIEGWYKDDRIENQETLKANLKQEQYRQDLHNQLGFNHFTRRGKIGTCELKFDANILGCEQHRENQRRKQEKTSHLLAEQKAFLEARKARKLKEKQDMLKDEEERARILVEKMMKENQTKEAKSDIVAVKESIFAKMTERILSEERAKQEREDATMKFLEEEEKNYLENCTKEEVLKKIQIAKESLEDIEYQHILKEESKAIQKKIDRQFSEYLEREREKLVMEDQRKDDENRAQTMQYGTDLREANECIRLCYTHGILKNQAILRKDQVIHEEKRKSIDDERSKMLLEHGIHLFGFLNFHN